MSWTKTETRLRDALLAAILPAPGRGLPAMEDVDLRAFWARFETAAPVHLRLGLRVASLVLGALPRVLGYERALTELSADEREAFITRAAGMPGVGELVEIAKVVACLAYFTDPAVQATARRRA
ncbi:MAG: hypothetical protein IPL19_29045 [Sandaracinaceae bacterium]|nr:hypothetical protein [Sandaracinaceae bacterium]MBK8412010.1 hypothetical protein [Sandaracinaceae bacterium]